MHTHHSYPLQRSVLKSRHRTTSLDSIYQRESLQDQRKSLTQAIESLRSPQRVYIPGCSGLLDDIDPATIIDTPESVKLWLPSMLPHTSRDAWCTTGLPTLEFRLRYAQAVDALDHLRRLRRLVRGLTLQAQKHPSPTQRTMTRSRSVFEGLQVRIAQVCSRYRNARTALLRLHPSGGWTTFFKELKKEDIRGPGREEDETSESRYIPSWIWMLQAPSSPPDLPGSLSPSAAAPRETTPTPPITTPPTGNKDNEVSAQEVEDCLLVDWAKAHERAKRFEEEVELCVEEMRRTLVFFSWKASKWEEYAQNCSQPCTHSKKPPSDHVIQGLQAYAHRQSAVFSQLISVFVSDWQNCLAPKGLGTKWLAKYSSLIVPRNGRNTIPSIMPSTLEQGEAEGDGDMLSDQDEVLDPPTECTVERDAEVELHEDFVQIIAEG